MAVCVIDCVLVHFHSFLVSNKIGIATKYAILNKQHLNVVKDVLGIEPLLYGAEPAEILAKYLQHSDNTVSIIVEQGFQLCGGTSIRCIYRLLSNDSKRFAACVSMSVAATCIACLRCSICCSRQSA